MISGCSLEFAMPLEAGTAASPAGDVVGVCEEEAWLWQ